MVIIIKMSLIFYFCSRVNKSISDYVITTEVNHKIFNIWKCNESGHLLLSEWMRHKTDWVQIKIWRTYSIIPVSNGWL